MDPDSGPKNTNTIDLPNKICNQNRVYFEELNGQKIFYLANFNDCNHSLVTCKAMFDDNYNLLSCYINISLLDGDYHSISNQDKILSLSDLFEIANKFNSKERFYLSFDGENICAYMIGNDYQIETTVDWILSYALKEDDFRYMDINDKMLEFLCLKLLSRKHYRRTSPFQIVENSQKNKIIIKTTN